MTKPQILAAAKRLYDSTGILTRDNFRQQKIACDKEVAKHFGSFAHLRKLVIPKTTIKKTEKTETEIREFGENSATIGTTLPNVRTLEELLAYMQVDLGVWKVERHTVNKWEMATREGRHEPLFQVKAWLIRKQPTVLDSAFEAVEGRITELVRKIPFVEKPSQDGDHLLEISLHDAHFGLLAWGRETNENYDLKIAEERYCTAIKDLLLKVRGWNPIKIVFPVGNDFFHVNNPEGFTPKAKNDLDTDGRLCKIVECGEAALLKAIKLCRQTAPVDVIWIPGNHDPETSYFMCRILKAAFSFDSGVEVDVAPSPRKYVHFGCNLIGFTHGDEERHADLPTIMAGEQKEVWSQVTHREWHLGHFHKKKETRYSAGDSYGGVAVKIIPSICGTDAWHFKKGYVCNDRVAEAFLYNRRTGLVATFTSRDVREIGNL